MVFLLFMLPHKSFKNHGVKNRQKKMFVLKICTPYLQILVTHSHIGGEKNAVIFKYTLSTYFFMLLHTD